MRRSLLSCGVDPDHLTCTPGDTPAATLRLAYGLLMHSITGRHALRAHVMDRLARDREGLRAEIYEALWDLKARPGYEAPPLAADRP
jgi:hypothetical protein